MRHGSKGRGVAGGTAVLRVDGSHVMGCRLGLLSSDGEGTSAGIDAAVPVANSVHEVGIQTSESVTRVKMVNQ